VVTQNAEDVKSNDLNDVLDIHNFLKEFDGDFIKLFTNLN
jgi:hypothetical protein